MGKTIAEKGLARAADVSSVAAGDIVEAYPDLCMSHTASWRCIATLGKLGTDQLYDPDRIAMVMDHISPAPTAKTANDHRTCRTFAQEHGIEKFFDVNSGIAHVVLMEQGHVLPGDLIIGTDSHSTIYGALGSLGTGVGYSEVTAVWVTGKLWMRVPESMLVTLRGQLQPGVYAKDLMLKLLGQLTSDGATYRSIEFGGEAIAAMTIDDRLTMCNLAMELGSKFGVVPPDETTFAYLDQIGVDRADYDPITADPDATYAAEFDIDLATLSPQIACPHRVDNVHPIEDVLGTSIDQVFIGSCANAKYEDLVEAARLLDGQRIASDVRLIVTPASRQIMQRATDDGLLSTFLEAGALITNPGCGGCAGDGGAMADGERTLSTANRNYRGRMGSYESEIYLGSPAVAAATAIRGVITDPRELAS